MFETRGDVLQSAHTTIARLKRVLFTLRRALIIDAVIRIDDSSRSFVYYVDFDLISVRLDSLASEVTL